MGRARRQYRFPWLQAVLFLLLLAAWLDSMLFTVTYTIAEGPPARMGDGDWGYDMVRSVGLAYGCVVFQTRHRQDKVGWDLQQEGFHCRLWILRENLQGYWTITTSGVSLLVPMMVIAATTIPYWRGRGPRVTPLSTSAKASRR